MPVVDASVWVSRFVVADVHHQASRRWLGRQLAAGEPLIAPAILLPEVAGAIARRAAAPDQAQRVVALLQRLPGVRLAPVSGDLAELAAQLAAALRLRGADALYVALASRLQLPLVTWDREQQERSQPLIAVSQPPETP